MSHPNVCTHEIVWSSDASGCVRAAPVRRTHLDLAALEYYRRSSPLLRALTSGSKKAKDLTRSCSAKASDLRDRLQRARSAFRSHRPDLQEALAEERERAKREAFDAIMKAETLQRASQFGPSEIPSLRPLVGSQTGYAVDDGSRGYEPIRPLRVVNHNSDAVSHDPSQTYAQPSNLTSSAKLPAADDALQISNADSPIVMELPAQESLEPSELHDTPLLELDGGPMPFERSADPIAGKNRFVQPHPTNSDIYTQHTTGSSKKHLQVPGVEYQLSRMNPRPRPHRTTVSVDLRKDRSRSMFLDTVFGCDLPAGLVAGVDASTEELIALYSEELPALLEEVEELYKPLPYPLD